MGRSTGRIIFWRTCWECTGGIRSRRACRSARPCGSAPSTCTVSRGSSTATFTCSMGTTAGGLRRATGLTARATRRSGRSMAAVATMARPTMFTPLIITFRPRSIFPQHPEWYSLLDGKRVAEGSQLCLTQPELRQAFLAKLLNYLDTSWAAAKAAGAPPPLVFSVSQNDCLNPCQCANCQAIAQAEESECGPLLDFVNYLADGIKGQYPEAYIDTLAYQYTQKAPKTIRPRDNVIVRLCDTESDPSQPITVGGEPGVPRASIPLGADRQEPAGVGLRGDLRQSRRDADADRADLRPGLPVLRRAPRRGRVHRAGVRDPGGHAGLQGLGDDEATGGPVRGLWEAGADFHGRILWPRREVCSPVSHGPGKGGRCAPDAL